MHPLTFAWGKNEVKQLNSTQDSTQHQPNDARARLQLLFALCFCLFLAVLLCVAM
jgi:hypothetical protein